jgi:hypothetical protein
MRLLNFTLSDPDPSIVKQKNRPTGRSPFGVRRLAATGRSQDIGIRVLPLKADGLESGFRLETQELMHHLLVDLLSRHFFGEHFTDHPGETCSPLGCLSRQKYVAYWP